MNDAGKVVFTPKGDYSSTVTYEYLDTVVYNGNAYAALKTTTGNAPTDSDTDENWKLLARGGTSVPIATEEIAGVVKAGSDIGVSDDGSMKLKTDFTAQESLAELTSGENRSTFFGKIAKAVADFILHKSTEASTTDYGHTILEDSIESTSTDKAATSASVKKAYDLANEAVPTANISQSSAITETGMHVLDAVEKNASVEGTLAHDIAELNSNLNNVSTLLNSMESKRFKSTLLKRITDAQSWVTVGSLSGKDIFEVAVFTGTGNVITSTFVSKIAARQCTVAYPYQIYNGSALAVQFYVSGDTLYIFNYTGYVSNIYI